MKEIYSDKVISSVSGKSFDETYYGSKLLDISVAGMELICRTAATPTQKHEKPIKAIIDSLVSSDSLGDVCYAVLEFILNGLTMHVGTKGSENKYRNVRRNTGNKIRKELLKLEDTDVNSVIAIQFIEMGLEALGDYVEVKRINDGYNHFQYRLSLEYSDSVQGKVRSKAESGYYALPTTEPPQDWSVTEDESGKVIVEGGYYGLKTGIIRGGGKIDMPASAFNPRFLLYNKQPIEALNLIQSTAYRINRGNLERVKSSLGDDPVKPKPSQEVIDSKRERFQFFEEYPTKELREEHNAIIPDVPVCVLEFDASVSTYKTVKGKLVAARLAIKIAEMFKDEPEIYFPHNFDYRGRIYPIPSSLTPQGDDISKGLLEFAHPTELTDEGVQVCYSYLASVWGHDKEPFDKRVELGKGLMDDVNIDYRNAEEPYVFCQVYDFLSEYEITFNPISRLAIAIDGSCNGLQHMAAITMDKIGGSYVNVGGENSRQDIYIAIAEHAASMMQHDIHNGSHNDNIDINNLILLHSILSGPKARKIAKRPVMINPYGGTFMGYKEYVLQSLQEFFPEHSTNDNASIITQYINRAMGEKLNGGSRYQKWVRSVFSGVSKLGVLPQFQTPDGFTVKNYSFKVDESVKRITSIVNRKGSSTIRLKVKTDEINSRKIGSRAQPNIIHALDATHLRMVALEMAKHGVKDLWFIHDSFATNPNMFALLNRVTREKFIELYSGENHPVECIINKLSYQLDRKGILYEFPEFPEFQEGERLELERVIENEFFFA